MNLQEFNKALKETALPLATPDQNNPILIEMLVRIKTLCETPGWSSDHVQRRERIRALAMLALEKIPASAASPGKTLPKPL